MKETTYKIESGLNFKIALIADSHGGLCIETIDSLNAVKPNLIAVVGDFIYGHWPKSDIQSIIDEQPNAIAFLESCVAIAPTYVSLGNHEVFLLDDDIERVGNTGVVLLDNEYISHDNGILIGGLSSGNIADYRKFRERYNAGKDNPERYPKRHDRPKWCDVDDSWLDEFEAQEDLKILLCHNPEYWSLRQPMLKNRKIDLVLSGHAHGGQIRLFGRGLYAPGQGWLPKYTKGIYHGEYGSLVISAGLSNTVRFIPRLFNLTEVVYVEL